MRIDVLNAGYVRLVDRMGSDLSVANAARVSFAKESAWIEDDDGEFVRRVLAEKDRRLIRFLARNGHTSPFRHAFATLEVKAPLFVARQWWKYVVGSDHTMDGWNEVSRRYVEDEPEFYVPREWRAAPENKKQGSGGAVAAEQAELAGRNLVDYTTRGYAHYRLALLSGICAEQARLFLPAYALYTTWRWSASLQSVGHFLRQRLEHDAQSEIREYAGAVRRIVEPLFPVSVAALLDA